MSDKNSNIVAFGIESETTQNTAVTLAAGSYLWLPRPQFNPNAEKITRSYVKTSLDPLAQITGKKSQGINFSMPLKWSLVSNTAYAPVLAAFKGMGFASSGGTGATDWTLSPISATVSSMLGPATAVTINLIMDGLKHVIAGAVGNGKLRFKAGERGFLDGEFLGIDAAVTDQSSWPTSPTQSISSVVEPIMESASFTMDNDTSHVAQEIEIDLGNKVVMIEDVSGTTGVKGFKIAGTKEPKVTISLLARTVASFDYWNKMRNSTLLNTSSLGLQFVLGTAAMNKFTFTMPVLQIEKAEYADYNGMLQIKLTCHPSQTSGNDWMTVLIDNA